MHHVSGHYPTFLATPSSCASPKPSSCLGATLAHQVFAGRCQPRLGVGPSRLCGSFPTCLDPYPGGSCSAHTRFFPQDIGLPDVRTRSSASQYPYSNFRMGLYSRLQSFTHVQARRFARHPDCSYRSAYPLRSRGFYVRAYHGSLPPRAPDMLTVRFGQLTVRGLPPLRIRSLVGCSPPGSQARSPSPSPLRTQRASFPRTALKPDQRLVRDTMIPTDTPLPDAHAWHPW